VGDEDGEGLVEVGGGEGLRGGIGCGRCDVFDWVLC